ncbi:MAG: FkbM family methyltransferase [Pseudomonadota bacterium]
MNRARFFELNYHLPKLQLLEVFPLTPYLWRYDGINVFDVGANTGLWSEAFLKTHGERAKRHFMYEPLPGNIKRLKARDGNVLARLCFETRIEATALGEAKGAAEIHFDQESSTLASLRNRQSDLGARVVELDRSVTVPVSTVDLEMDRHGLETLHLLKIDVEGFELNVLKGAEAALSAGRIKNVYFEFGGHQTRNGETFRLFFDRLTSYGFTVYKSRRGRNFFGTAPILRYGPSLEPETKAVEMVLASLEGPDPDYIGPRVVGQPIAP